MAFGLQVWCFVEGIFHQNCNINRERNRNTQGRCNFDPQRAAGCVLLKTPLNLIVDRLWKPNRVSGVNVFTLHCPGIRLCPPLYACILGCCVLTGVHVGLHSFAEC